MTHLTPNQRRALVVLLVLVALLAGVIGYGLGWHAMTVAALLDNAVQGLTSAIIPLTLVVMRR